MKQWNGINWADADEKISEHFTVKEALYLNEWKRLATEADGLTTAVKFSICRTADKMDEIRELLNRPLFVKSWYRPKEYNKLIGGAKESSHMEGLACDFWADVNGDGDKTGEDCDAIKEILKNWLLKLDIRMEDNGPRKRWVHVDLKYPKGARYFKP